MYWNVDFGVFIQCFFLSQLLRTVQTDNGRPLVGTGSQTLAGTFDRTWVCVETARIRCNGFMFDFAGWTDHPVPEGIPKAGIVATCSFEGEHGFRELQQTFGTELNPAPFRTMVMLARWRPDVFAMIAGDPRTFVNQHAITPLTNPALYARLDQFLQLRVSHEIISEDEEDD